MGNAALFAEELVEAEIRRLVGEAVKNQSTVSTVKCVASIKQLYPTCGLSKREISDKVIAAASVAGIAVEIGAFSELGTYPDSRHAQSSTRELRVTCSGASD